MLQIDLRKSPVSKLDLQRVFKEVLLHSDFDLHQTYEGMTPIEMASSYHLPQLAELLMEISNECEQKTKKRRILGSIES